mgnify:FL=1
MNKTKEDKGIKSKKKINNKKNNSRRILISIVTILLLVIIGISIYFILKNNKNIDELDNNLEENNQEKSASLSNYENMNNVELIDGKKKNNSKALLEEKNFKGLKVKDIKLEEIRGTTNFSAKLENNTDDDFKSCIIVLIFTNEDGTEYARLEGSIADIPKGKSTVLDASTTSDLTNAFDFRIEEI